MTTRGAAVSAKGRGSGGQVRAVAERAREGAKTPGLERQPLIGDAQARAPALDTRLRVVGDQRPRGPLIGHRVPEADADVVAGVEPRATRAVIRLDRRGAHRDLAAGRCRPRERRERAVAAPAGEQPPQRRALARVGALIEIDGDVPRRAGRGLVVAKASTIPRPSRSTSSAWPFSIVQDSAPAHTPSRGRRSRRGRASWQPHIGSQLQASR